jgi:hypothetical protein
MSAFRDVASTASPSKVQLDHRCDSVNRPVGHGGVRRAHDVGRSVSGESLPVLLADERARNFAGCKVDASGGLGERQVHLIGVLDRLRHLFFERCEAAVAEEHTAVP